MNSSRLQTDRPARRCSGRTLLNRAAWRKRLIGTSDRNSISQTSRRVGHHRPKEANCFLERRFGERQNVRIQFGSLTCRSACLPKAIREGTFEVTVSLSTQVALWALVFGSMLRLISARVLDTSVYTFFTRLRCALRKQQEMKILGTRNQPGRAPNPRRIST